MKINKFLTVVDYGSKKIRLSIFDKSHKKIYSTCENQISDQNAETKSYKINIYDVFIEKLSKMTP